jgi:hypothetical protein
MKEPKKFALINDEDGCHLALYPYGDWIKYSDYQKVKQLLNEAVTVIEQLALSSESADNIETADIFLRNL